MAGTDARGARIVRLLEDPAVGGDLLLVAVALAAKYDFGVDYGGSLTGMAALIFPGQHTPVWRLKEACRKDIRTYEPPLPGRATCLAPMVRRDGVCGRNATCWGYLTDWSTGIQSYTGGCSRHAGWFHKVCHKNWAGRPDVVPLPPANAGGALRHHFPRIDWPTFWRRLDPRWVEHPEAQAWPKPDLTLVLGDAADADAASGRPLLAVLPMGGSR
jgi:hypothetical protein